VTQPHQDDSGQDDPERAEADRAARARSDSDPAETDRAARGRSDPDRAEASQSEAARSGPDRAAAGRAEAAPPAGETAGWTVLARDFLDRPAVEVAPELLGCVLRSTSPEGTVDAVIVEVEAYSGLTDPASHAYRGKTPRNAVMFGEPGHAYVYFTYGMHFCVNLVCMPPGEASAVLLRAARIIAGTDLALARRRPAPAAARPLPERDVARGPARLCQALGIDRSFDGMDVCDPGSPLAVGVLPGWQPAPADAIRTGPRVGVTRAADIPWRFWLADETASVSSYKRAVARRSTRKPVTGRGPGDGTMHG
jgi:DNA-3-methyladenine glycosylase